MTLTLGEAAKRTGKSKATLSRAINTGKVSATRNGDNSFSIEESELYRVYKRVFDATHTTLKNAASDERGTVGATPEREIQIALLEAELAAAKDKIEDLKQLADEIRSDRDAWKMQAARLLAAPSRGPKLGLWRRLFGE